MSYYYRINMSDFWELDSSIVEVINPNNSNTEIIIQTSEPVSDPLQTFSNEEEVCNFANASGSLFGSMDMFISFFEKYVPEFDNPILLSTGSAE